MTVARLVTAMAIVFIGLFAFQNCGQAKKVAAFDPGTLTASSSTSFDGTYSVSTWTCNQKDILTTLSYSGVTAIKVVVAGSTLTQTISFGTTCASTEAYPLTYSNLTAVTLTQSSVSCGTSCTASQCKAVAKPASPATMYFDFVKSVDSNTITMTHVLTSYDVTSTGWPYGGSGCGVGNTVTWILSK